MFRLLLINRDVHLINPQVGILLIVLTIYTTLFSAWWLISSVGLIVSGSVGVYISSQSSTSHLHPIIRFFYYTNWVRDWIHKTHMVIFFFFLIT